MHAKQQNPKSKPRLLLTRLIFHVSSELIFLLFRPAGDDNRVWMSAGEFFCVFVTLFVAANANDARRHLADGWDADEK